MVQTPELLAERWVEAGCERLIVHAESVVHLHRTLGHVRSLGVAAAVAINPATPATAVAHVLDLVDMVLVMTVNPGFGGQEYIATMEPKIAEVRAMIDAARPRRRRRGRRRHRPDTVAGAAGAGANVLVAGSALFRDPDGLGHAVEELRTRAEADALTLRRRRSPRFRGAALM